MGLGLEGILRHTRLPKVVGGIRVLLSLSCFPLAFALNLSSRQTGDLNPVAGPGSIPGVGPPSPPPGCVDSHRHTGEMECGADRLGDTGISIPGDHTCGPVSVNLLRQPTRAGVQFVPVCCFVDPVSLPPFPARREITFWFRYSGAILRLSEGGGGGGGR